MDAVRDAHHPDVIMRVIEGVPEPSPFVGREAVMQQFEHLREAWDTDTIQPISDFIDVVNRVVVRIAWRAIGRGPETSLEFTIVCTMRNGRIHYVEHIRDHPEALEAAGLSE
jgi:ketosteroid isomerase-like protein